MRPQKTVSTPGTVTPIALPAITSAQASARKGQLQRRRSRQRSVDRCGLRPSQQEEDRQLTAPPDSSPCGMRAPQPPSGSRTRAGRDLLRQFPLDSANAGALIGAHRQRRRSRAVCHRRGQLDQTVPATGELFLAANVPKEVGAQGTYQVLLKITAGQAHVPGHRAAGHRAAHPGAARRRTRNAWAMSKVIRATW